MFLVFTCAFFFCGFARKDEGTFIFSKLMKTNCEKLVVHSYCSQLNVSDGFSPTRQYCLIQFMDHLFVD